MHTFKSYLAGVATTALVIVGMHRLAGTIDPLGRLPSVPARPSFSDATLPTDLAFSDATLPTDLAFSDATLPTDLVAPIDATLPTDIVTGNHSQQEDAC